MKECPCICLVDSWKSRKCHIISKETNVLCWAEGEMNPVYFKCSVLLPFFTVEWVSLLSDILNMKFPYCQMSIDLLYFQKVY